MLGFGYGDVNDWEWSLHFVCGACFDYLASLFAEGP